MPEHLAHLGIKVAGAPENLHRAPTCKWAFTPTYFLSRKSPASYQPQSPESVCPNRKFQDEGNT